MKKSEKPSIRYIDWGIASRVEDIIYINRKLLWRPKLCDRLIKHEKEHSSSHNKNDFLLDLGIKELEGIRPMYWDFVLTHPKSWVAFLPIKRIEGNWIINPNLIAAWIIFLVAFKIVHHYMGKIIW